MLKILIADDEPIERRYLTTLFQKYSERFLVIGEAANGQEVLTMALNLKPDIVLMDINMPLLNGLNCSQVLKEHLPNVIILLNTAYAEFEFAKKALDYQLDAYLLKPASEEEILNTIENCLSKKNFISSCAVPSVRTESLMKQYSENDAVDKVRRYIEENFHCQISLSELAEMVHFSSPYLSRLFHQTTGFTVKAYLTKQRLENAKYLLKHTELPIQEIAANCGFSSTSHFNRVFRQQVCITPLAYRHQRT